MDLNAAPCKKGRTELVIDFAGMLESASRERRCAIAVRWRYSVASVRRATHSSVVRIVGQPSRGRADEAAFSESQRPLKIKRARVDTTGADRRAIQRWSVRSCRLWPSLP
jgi:hypothetical protein